jgi:acetyl esterase/lipase
MFGIKQFTPTDDRIRILILVEIKMRNLIGLLVGEHAEVDCVRMRPPPWPGPIDGIAHPLGRLVHKPNCGTRNTSAEAPNPGDDRPVAFINQQYPRYKVDSPAHERFSGHFNMSLVTYQPFKGLYALTAITFEFFRLPFWILKYFFRFGRQHPKWSFRQAFSVRVFKAAVHHIAVIQVPTPLPLTPGAEKERFIVISPGPKEKYVGPLTENEDVVPVSIGGSWYPAPLTAEGSKNGRITVILHIHGGAYVIGDGRTKASGYFAHKLLKYVGATHVFMPQYRLSTLPPSKTSNPFPAALQDTLTSYLYLINELGIKPEDIVLSGDSAGANAAISLLKYISQYGADLDIPTPSAALLWSPWVHPKDGLQKSKLVGNKNYGTDYLSYPFTRWGCHAYAGAKGVQVLDSEYASHKGKPFQTPVPMFVNTGGAELLFHEDVEWAEMMQKEGNRVQVDIEEIAPHDVLLVGGNLGFDKEATACAKRAGEWLREVRKSA